ncbi:response regulator transcription factor [Thiomicrospira aerophila]|uniref:response regulator transcription factor n=1 Tax=Thiomicrospira aerophila TaxID=92245 RepID=UPI00022C1A9E|nr:response regulator transcription factor [Thiomicrospira aerophila]
MQADTCLIAGRVLLVEDDPDQLADLSHALKVAEFSVLEASNQDEAITQLKDADLDILVSDIILDGDFDAGFKLANYVREHYAQLPIIFLSERREADDIWQGHQLGAVDYLAKPLHTPLLIQKLHNLLRITQGRKTYQQDFITALVDAQLQIQPNQAQISWRHQPVQLTLTEFEMLNEFARHPADTLISYDALTKATQGVVERNTINTHICRIRQAFRKQDPQFDHIQNVYGRGYKWRP